MYGLSSTLGEILKVGSRGDTVSDTQRRLQALGFTLRVDGVFGNETMKAVMKFQKSVGLRADGIVGDRTQTAMDKALLPTQSTPSPIIEWGKQHWEYIVLAAIGVGVVYTMATWE